MNIKFFKKGDLIVIAVIIVAASVFAFAGWQDTSKPIAEISVDGVTVQTVDLSTVMQRTEIRRYRKWLFHGFIAKRE